VADAADARGNVQARANQLEAYRNEVRALQRAHQISDATAALLLALAGTL